MMRRTGLLLGALCAVSAAQAITFTPISITGPGSFGGTVGPFGSSGIEYTLPSLYVTGAGVNAVTLHYQVTATAGHYLTSLTALPNGSARFATVDIVAAHNPGPQTLVMSQTAGGTLEALNSGTMNFAGQESFFDVFVDIDLTNAGITSISKVSILSLTYTEQVVPEPASLLALGIGSVSLLRRRAKRRN
ncbi:MAG: PEP-CTERM sorting domain-containing protein [Armatimonadetes bacterium]|nr:MAG: PEP-CTERM sorting domain-containing protein [Armatimonadota bacterium]